MPPTRSCTFIAMPHTFRSPMQEATREACFFFRKQPPENLASVIKNMVASAAESEVGACFHNAQSGAHSESQSLNWATYSPRRQYEHITLPHLTS
jgi:hypothetical protein